MDVTKLLPVIAAVVLLHILLNALLSKEILQWVPSIQKRIILFICVWFIPFVGIIITYKSLDLDWLKKKSKKSASGQSSIGGAFLEVDSIFNPGQKHVVEAKQKEVIEKKEEGDMYKKDKQDLNELN
jgi:hypothetical protein